MKEYILDLQERIKNLTEERDFYKDYARLFKTYYNEDWNRNSPFAKQIDFVYECFLMRNVGVFSFSSPVKYFIAPYSEEQLSKQIKELFGERHLKSIENAPFFHFILFTASLKIYSEDFVSDYRIKANSPDEFLDQLLEIEFDKYKNKY